VRGAANVYRESERLGNGRWFNIDRGYSQASHFDGKYRISFQGTQAKWHEGIPRKPVDIKLEPWRTGGKYTLIIPPTEHVGEFFLGWNLGHAWEGGSHYTKLESWIAEQKAKCAGPTIVRYKNDPMPISEHLHHASAVITFNSSVGWQALQCGIPVLSDPNHSIVGSWAASKGKTDLQTLIENSHTMQDNRLELFEAMQAHQFTLAEIRQGRAWDLIKHYTATSDGIAEKPLPPQSVSIPSGSGLKAIYQSHI
jgi:hypothetical protein